MKSEEDLTSLLSEIKSILETPRGTRLPAPRMARTLSSLLDLHETRIVKLKEIKGRIENHEKD